MIKLSWKLQFLFLSLLLLAGCTTETQQVLRLATTTSTYDSGLLDVILPEFEAAENVRVDVVAVGTGQALALGEAGDTDVVLVHARSREEQFVDAGHGLFRRDVMFNDFVIVGPKDDPAGIKGIIPAADALPLIAATETPFASRGDDSGTHIREQNLWAQAGLEPDAGNDWYSSLGQGMGATLTFANETGAYTLTDRGTYMSMGDVLGDLSIMLGGDSIDENFDSTLYNPYGIIPINPDKGNIEAELSQTFIDWITSESTQIAIGRYGYEKYGQPLFYPHDNSD